jgi:hypothetical protein
LKSCPGIGLKKQRKTAKPLRIYGVLMETGTQTLAVTSLDRHYYVVPFREIIIDMGRMIFFSIYLILPAALGPGVYSVSNINEYQKQKNNVSGE